MKTISVNQRGLEFLSPRTVFDFSQAVLTRAPSRVKSAPLTSRAAALMLGVGVGSSAPTDRKGVAVAVSAILLLLAVTSQSVVGLLAIWAGLGRGHWFVRVAALAAVLALALLIPAYELVVVFTVQCLVVVPTLLVARRLRARAEGKPASQFTIRDLLAGDGGCGGGLGRRGERAAGGLDFVEFPRRLPPFILRHARLAALVRLPDHRADRRLRDARGRRRGLGSLATMVAILVVCCSCYRSWRRLESWCTSLPASEPVGFGFRRVSTDGSPAVGRTGGHGCPASHWVCCFLRSRCPMACVASRGKSRIEPRRRATSRDRVAKAVRSSRGRPWGCLAWRCSRRSRGRTTS